MKVKKLDTQLHILINSDVKDKAEKVLFYEGLSISEYVRYCLQQKAIMYKNHIHDNSENDNI